mmetsp:Transcript_18791/g.33345  ORF Transcript_18791/g.33345 Transcript_18791/m.33345 type:complete len:352 (+) Transcript_18791:180-1235(+)
MADLEDAVKNLVEMGFSEERSRQALSQVETKTADAALEVLVKGEDAALGKEGEAAAEAAEEGAKAAGVPKSYRCTDTGKLFRTLQDAQLYAERTGNANFEESDIEVPPLTPEEKAAKIQQIRELLKKKRAEREVNDAAEQRRMELERRKGGQEMAEIREQHERIQREAEYAARRKEKELFKKEKERLRIEVAKDKGERASSAAIAKGATPEEAKKAYDEAYQRSLKKGAATEGASSTAATSSPGSGEDQAIKDLLSYRAGGDGVRALATAKKMLGNIVKSPAEPKFRSINLQNEAFKKRVASLIGGVALFKACGFVKRESDGQLVLDEADTNIETLEQVIDKITKAIEAEK